MNSDKPLFYQSNLSIDQQNHLLDEETRKHVVTVLRMKEGDAFTVTNGAGLSAKAVLQKIDKKQAFIMLDEFQQHERKGNRITLGISLLKNNTRFEWMLEKVTELGVYEIFPLLLDRTERQHFRKERFEQIIRSASLQSEQYFFPLLHEPINLSQLLQKGELPITRMIAHCYSTEKKSIEKIPVDAILLIGPEGDFTEDELQLAMQNQFIPVEMGATRLRTETAGIVGVALLRG
jgi:16S rRNA (uracil1498-N3)-methyltransferase